MYFHLQRLFCDPLPLLRGQRARFSVLQDLKSGNILLTADGHAKIADVVQSGSDHDHDNSPIVSCIV
jgi:serine/threonine protein kinase